ncbi:MAG: biopolymer transporter ExbD [Magnetococcales bacterium]|nr:biopolymer transporter ExbD [Magnetococcales bacterium]
MSGILDSEGEDRPLAEINVTPLVDVMLVLLVIFIILAPAMLHSLKINLPRAEGEQPLVATPLTIVLRADGSTMMGEEEVAATVLAHRLRAAVEQDPEVLLRIDGDGATRYESLAQLLALAQGQGVSRITFTMRGP